MLRKSTADATNIKINMQDMKSEFGFLKEDLLVARNRNIELENSHCLEKNNLKMNFAKEKGLLQADLERLTKEIEGNLLNGVSNMIIK